MQQLRTVKLDELGKFLVERLRHELTQQGHVLTGALRDSIRFELDIQEKDLVLRFLYLDYGEDMNKGVPASRIPQSGTAMTRRINDLARWVSMHGLAAGPSARRVAFFINRTHSVTGMPSPGAFAFSRNGRRIGFQDHTIATQRTEIFKQSQEAMRDMVQHLLISIFADVARSNRFIFIR